MSRAGDGMTPCCDHGHTYKSGKPKYTHTPITPCTLAFSCVRSVTMTHTMRFTHALYPDCFRNMCMRTAGPSSVRQRASDLGVLLNPARLRDGSALFNSNLCRLLNQSINGNNNKNAKYLLCFASVVTTAIATAGFPFCFQRRREASIQ